MEESATIPELALMLGVTERTARDYVKRGCPRGPLEAATKWKAENIADNGPPSVGERAAKGYGHLPQAKDLRERELLSRIAKNEEEARSKRIKNDMLMGELVYRHEVITEAAEMLNFLRCQLEDLPEIIAKEFGGNDRLRVLAMVEHHVHLWMKKVAQWKPVPPTAYLELPEELKTDDVH